MKLRYSQINNYQINFYLQMDYLQNFRNKEILRNQIQCPDSLNVILDHCQYVIHGEFDKNSKQVYKYKKRKHQISPYFLNAFQNLNRQQKVLFYLRTVLHVENLSKGIQIQPAITEVKMKPIQALCECKSFNLKIWKVKNIRLDRTRHQVMVQNEKDKKIKMYELRNYLIRKSKTKSKHALVLEAINDLPPQKSRQVHIAFQDEQKLKIWYTLIRQQVEVCEWLNVREMVLHQGNGSYNSGPKSIKQSRDLLNTSITSINSLSKKQLQSQQNDVSEDQMLKEQKKLDQQEGQIMGKRKTFIQRLVNDDCADFEEFFDVIDDQTQLDVEQKKNIDFFHKLLPDYDLDSLGDSIDCQTLLEEDGSFKIMQNTTNPNRFKITLQLPSTEFNTKQIFCLISQPRYTSEINDNIQEQTVKTLLKSENSAIMYQTLKAYNKFYRHRDFVFIRHAFSHNGNFYLVDKSIDNINFPPFMTLVRGEITAVWGIFTDEKSQQITLTGDFVIVNGGLLSSQQETNLSLKYLSGFKELLKQKADNAMESSMFDIDWNIDKKEQNKKMDDIRVRRKTLQTQFLKVMPTKSTEEQISFTKKSSSYQEASSSPQKSYKITQSTQLYTTSLKKVQQKNFNENNFEVPVKQQSSSVLQKQVIAQRAQQKSEKLKNQGIFETDFQVKRKINSQGYVIVDHNCIKNKQIVIPTQKLLYQQSKIIKGHAIWKGEWTHDTKLGGMIYINQKKIQDQKGVLKFILTKIGKNILSGKSILNISLPVDIFSPESNLERLLTGMVYGPKLLEDLNKKSLLQKLAKVVSFGVSNSVMYIGIEKPFNPILGQTLQCWINGCPAYGQQISHHPPIAALMFVGRGYQVTAQLESKVELHMNSGCGLNEGIYKVQFDDGTQIGFMTPGGEISGLTFGQRKLNLVGKSYYWSEKDRIFLQLNYEAGKKSFFSKQQKPGDYFQGKVYEVTPDFFKTFPKIKKREPSDKEKVRELGVFQGVWSKYVKFNSKEVFNFDQVLPLRLEYERQPLASDSNWREDIEYRRLNKITRAQTEKERLEVVQRGDRKFREKYKKKESK